MRASRPGQRLCSAPEGGTAEELLRPEREIGGSPASIIAACSWSECDSENGTFCVSVSCGFHAQRFPDHASGGIATAVRDEGESGLMIGRSKEKAASVLSHSRPA